MPAKRITVRAPATTANLGPGFDCLGLALDLWAEVVVTAASEPVPPRGRPAAGDGGAAAPPPLLAPAASRRRRVSPSLARKGIPVARGLGASAVARAAGLLAANALLGGRWSREEMLALGAELEGHADNMAPALFGGLQVAVREGTACHAGRCRCPRGLKVVLSCRSGRCPPTRAAVCCRQPVPREDAVFNVGRVALLVAALAAGRLDLLDTATADRLHQPARSQAPAGDGGDNGGGAEGGRPVRLPLRRRLDNSGLDRRRTRRRSPAPWPRQRPRPPAQRQDDHHDAQRCGGTR